MTIDEAILFADQVMFDNTGKHLDDMQVALLQSVFRRQKYVDVAKELNCSEGYVKDVAYELWKMFSIFFDEDVNKSNIGSALLRNRTVNSFNFNIFGNDNNNVVNSVQICSSEERSSEFLRGKQQAYRQAILRMRELSLNDSQISEYLGVDLRDFEF
jgi:hypothetical protein